MVSQNIYFLQFAMLRNLYAFGFKQEYGERHCFLRLCNRLQERRERYCDIRRLNRYYKGEFFFISLGILFQRHVSMGNS